MIVKRKKIMEFANVVTGGTPSTFKKEYWENGDIPWLQSGCCHDCVVNKADKYITKQGYDNSNVKLMPKNTVMIALTGATAGRVGFLTFEACGNQSITGILPNDSFDSKYLFYCLKSKRNKIISDCVGGAQPHISQNYVKNIEIPYYEIQKQTEIAKDLDNICELKGKDEKILNDIDELIKSRFVEMFGDKNIEKKMLEDISIVKGEYGASSAAIPKVENRPRYVRITDINDDGSLNNDYTCSDNIDDDITYKLEIGDFLFARMGATVGKTYVCKENNQIFAGYLIRYKLNKNIINPIFLYWYTKSDEYKNWVITNQSGAAQPGINAKKYNSLLIPCADIDKQNDFATFVDHCDKLKVVVKKRIKLLEELMENKMHEYFDED